MALPKLPTTGLDDINHRRRHREVTNSILDFSFDDSRVRTAGEITAGVTPVNYAYPPGHVKRYGVKGDGATDDTTAIQNAINAAGVAGEVFFPLGTYLCTGSLTGLNFQTWRGECFELGAGGSQSSLKCTKTNGTFITAGANPKFENLRFLGVVTYTESNGNVADSTCIALKLTDGGVTFSDCVFQSQFFCVETAATGAFYFRWHGGEVNRCGVFLNMTGADVFDMEIDNGATFRFCSTVVSSNDSPKRYVHNLKVLGCSFEQWQALFNYIRSASFFGTYFESDITGGFGFNSNAGFVDNDTSISLFGCLIFINNLNRFVNYGGLSGCTFVSIGNVIAGSVNSGESQYYFVPQNAGTGRTVMLGDYLDDRGTGTFRGSYTSDDTKLVNQLIVWPRGTTADHAKVGQTWVDGAVTLKRKVITYSASMTPDLRDGIEFDITATNGTAFTINAPSNPVDGQRITFTIRNTSGGALGAVTWNAVFKMSAWTSPATANSRSIDFRYDGTNWVQVSQTGVDVPN